MNKSERFTGQTRDTGFQIGVRRTLPIQHEAAWQLLSSPKGVAIWLGEIEGELAQGAVYRLANGTAGEVTVFLPNSHLRLTWQPPTWQRPSVIQVRVLPAGNRTTISFHQEWLPGPEEREQRRVFFAAALEKMQKSPVFKNQNSELPDHSGFSG